MPRQAAQVTGKVTLQTSMRELVQVENGRYKKGRPRAGKV